MVVRRGLRGGPDGIPATGSAPYDGRVAEPSVPADPLAEAVIMSVERLSDEQVSRIHAIRDEWFAVGTSTAPADRPAAETAVNGLYAQLGEPPPMVVWADSPLAAVRTALTSRDGRATLRPPLQAALRSAMETVPEPSWATVVESVRGDEVTQRWAAVWSQLGLSPEATLWSATRTSLGDSLEKSVGSTIAAALRAARDEPGSGPGDPGRDEPEPDDGVDDALWGQLEAGWIAFHDARRRLGEATFTGQATAELDRWAALARSCGWWWPYQGLCILSERPAVVTMEPTPGRDAYRLHRTDGPALRFRDGWEVYAWHGTRVPRSFIEHEWSVADILAEPTFEVRQRGIERMGWDRFLTEAAFRPAALGVPAPDDNGTLALYDVPEQLFGQPARMLVWTPAGLDHDLDPKVYAMAVPTDLTDPVEAFNWTWEHDEAPSLEIHPT
jgi:hypothetical protein